MFEIEEKAKRKAKPHQRSRLFIGSGIFLVMSFLLTMVLIAMILLFPYSVCGCDMLSSPIAMTNAAVARQIEQTNIARTQIFLATTSPNALTPTPSP